MYPTREWEFSTSRAFNPPREGRVCSEERKKKQILQMHIAKQRKNFYLHREIEADDFTAENAPLFRNFC